MSIEVAAKSREIEVQEWFARDVADHEMEIVRDEGLSRHLRFRKPGTIIHSFDMITWPGYLCISGDCGCYVFSRLKDMFEFFRDDDLRINPHYWAEKVKAQDRDGGVSEWSEDAFMENVRDHVSGHFDDADEQRLREALDSLEEHFGGLDNEYDAMDAISRWDDPDELGIEFVDFWEYDNREYTYRYLWCCYAIVWGIQQYDATLQSDEESGSDE